jgi:predicted RNase H-like HicB family nuclease
MIGDEELRLRVRFEDSDGIKVATIDGMGLASQGDTYADAMFNLKEAFELYFDGESDDFIKRKISELRNGSEEKDDE